MRMEKVKNPHRIFRSLLPSSSCHSLHLALAVGHFEQHVKKNFHEFIYVDFHLYMQPCSYFNLCERRLPYLFRGVVYKPPGFRKPCKPQERCKFSPFSVNGCSENFRRNMECTNEFEKIFLRMRLLDGILDSFLQGFTTYLRSLYRGHCYDELCMIQRMVLSVI